MNNASAIGYMILAAKRAEVDYELIHVLESHMLEEMDFTTEEEAERAYREF